MLTGRRILVVTDAYLSPRSSLSRALVATIETLSKRGYYVRRVTPMMRPTAPIPFQSDITMTLPPYNIDRLLSRVDAVFIDTEGPLGIAARNACVRAEFPFTTAFHNHIPSMLSHKGMPDFVAYGYFKWFHQYSHAILTPTRRMFNSLNGRGFKNVKVWGRGVDTNIFKYRPIQQIGSVFRLPDTWMRPFWLHIGNLDKNEDGLFEFCNLKVPGTKIIIGDGPHATWFEKKYPEIKFMGEKSDYDRAYIYNQVDTFVFANRTDHIGLTNFEAIASGTPVASYPVTATVDVVEDGKTGVLDEDLTAACIKSLTLCRQAPKIDLSWDGVVDRLLENLVFVDAR